MLRMATGPPELLVRCMRVSVHVHACICSCVCVRAYVMFLHVYDEHVYLPTQFTCPPINAMLSNECYLA